MMLWGLRMRKKRYYIGHTEYNHAQQTEEVISQVLDEIGINLSSQLADAPTQSTAATATKRPVAATAEAAPSSDIDDLQARLDNLRK
jgi:charged multivesicular body protein 2A